jgi:hypothetical protein
LELRGAGGPAATGGGPIRDAVDDTRPTIRREGGMARLTAPLHDGQGDSEADTCSAADSGVDSSDQYSADGQSLGSPAPPRRALVMGSVRDPAAAPAPVAAGPAPPTRVEAGVQVAMSPPRAVGARATIAGTGTACIAATTPRRDSETTERDPTQSSGSTKPTSASPTTTAEVKDVPAAVAEEPVVPEDRAAPAAAGVTKNATGATGAANAANAAAAARDSAAPGRVDLGASPAPKQKHVSAHRQGSSAAAVVPATPPTPRMGLQPTPPTTPRSDVLSPRCALFEKRLQRRGGWGSSPETPPPPTPRAAANREIPLTPAERRL